MAIVESVLATTDTFERSPASLGATGRLVALALAVGSFALLCIAAKLTPSPDGMATHTQLHLQHCGFLESTGLPCPSCGMTTSFSWFARGNIVASAYVQPMGIMLAILAAATVWIGSYVAITGKPVYRLVSDLPAKYHVFPLMILALAAWAWKIFIHLHGIDGWRR